MQTEDRAKGKKKENNNNGEMLSRNYWISLELYNCTTAQLVITIQTMFGYREPTIRHSFFSRSFSVVFFSSEFSGGESLRFFVVTTTTKQRQKKKNTERTECIY